MSFTNLLLSGNWSSSDWPEHVDVSHEGRLDCKRYVPRRICRMEYDTVHRDYVCSACGEWFDTHGYVRKSGVSLHCCVSVRVQRLCVRHSSG